MSGALAARAGDPRRLRLESDERGLRALARASGGTIRIEAAEGRPPTRYVVALRCRGVVALEAGAPRFALEHRIEIALGAAYPIVPAEVRFATPIFNPHVFPDARVCLGVKTGMTERLEDLVLRIGALIQYEPALLDLTSPANLQAAVFARAAWSGLPFGREMFRAAPPAARAPAIVWADRT